MHMKVVSSYLSQNERILQFDNFFRFSIELFLDYKHDRTMNAIKSNRRMEKRIGDRNRYNRLIGLITTLEIIN